MTVKPQQKRQKGVTIDDPQSDFYSFGDTSSDSDDDLNQRSPLMNREGHP